MTDAVRQTPDHWAHLLESIDLELAQEAIICHVRLLDPGVIERVLHGDDSVCGKAIPHAFEKLRGLLYLHYTTETEVACELGPEAAALIAEGIREHLRGRIGDQLGGLA